MKVQVKTERCNSKVRPQPYCNCGAAVAVGRDVFVVNDCDGEIPRFRSCGDGVMKDLVFESSGDYIVSYISLYKRCRFLTRSDINRAVQPQKMT